MLKGTTRELKIGRTDLLSVDVGPVITSKAKETIEEHLERMRGLGCKVEQIGHSEENVDGTFVPPTIVEIETLSDLEREVFGPVLHVLRYRREDLDSLIDDVNATGYGLTFGLHTRLDETIVRVTSRIKAGNIYVNGNVIGAVVGVQPFGGRGLSGTGPKAGGPLYLSRLVTPFPIALQNPTAKTDTAFLDLEMWLEGKGCNASADSARHLGRLSMLGYEAELPGPVGERNIYALHPRGLILLVPETENGLYHQLGAVLATGNCAVIDAASGLQTSLAGLPPNVASRVSWSTDWIADRAFGGVLIEGKAERMILLKPGNADLRSLTGNVISFMFFLSLVVEMRTASHRYKMTGDRVCLRWETGFSFRPPAVFDLAEQTFLRIHVGTQPFVDGLVKGIALPVGV